MRSSVVAIGMFDGVHRAHQKILRAAVQDARCAKARSIAFTFQQHPQMVMRRKKCPLITHTAQKVALLKRSGIVKTLVVAFSKRFAHTEPKAFVRRVLLQRLGMKELCVGYDFTFGCARRGNVALLQKLSREWQFKLRVFAPVRYRGRIVSSTWIRELLQAGDCRGAHALLGRWYSMQGVVEKGLGLGKVLGFPTANIRMCNETLLPHGVYAVKVRGAGSLMRPGVLNAGVRPTLGGSGKAKTSWELHLWNWRGDLLGKELEVFFVRRLRAEKKFPSLAALSRQIAKDVQAAKEIL